MNRFAASFGIQFAYSELQAYIPAIGIRKRKTDLQNFEPYVDYLHYEGYANSSHLASYLYSIYVHVISSYEPDPTAHETPPFAQLRRVGLRLGDVDSVAFKRGGQQGGGLTTSVIDWIMEACEKPPKAGVFYLPMSNFGLYQAIICPNSGDRVYPNSSHAETWRNRVQRQVDRC
ncbi:hypothetical protein CC80DRAFT_497494 [Byssothecium circinans]|uniref:Uncharacterized protein n=1 Tax=Byssothecium circinans TaxID=147558 RepID=A0A6A5TCR8_9PLEO|nr:hypothetical protein CC80DRAFT_497494 [Byssothecium circinans]